MKLTPSPKIYSDKSLIANAGRGIFAAIDIKKDEIIEQCPLIVIVESEVSHLRNMELYNYYFMWGGDENSHKAAICLGYGSLYNHSYTPNATYKKLLDKDLVEFVAIKDILTGQEITVNYNYGNPDDKSKLWIDSIPPAEL